MRLAFLTGTRADWGKLVPLVNAVRDTHDVHVIATGQHLTHEQGYTLAEVERQAPRVWAFANGVEHGRLSASMGQTLMHVGHLLDTIRPDALVVHGDRTEALAGALAARFAGVRVWHVEGGERSGSLDDMTRSAITQYADLHLAAGENEAGRLAHAGVWHEDIQIIGSPEVDTLLGELPSMHEVAERYGLQSTMQGTPANYGVCIYHPTIPWEPGFDAALRRVTESWQWVVLQPNSDPGGDSIDRMWRGAVRDGSPIRYLPSMRFEHFATLIKHAAVVLGNSSCGVREAPVFGTPVVNIGGRQEGRSSCGWIRHVREPDADLIKWNISEVWGKRYDSVREFGDGRAGERFRAIVDAMEGKAAA